MCFIIKTPVFNTDDVVTITYKHTSEIKFVFIPFTFRKITFLILVKLVGLKKNNQQSQNFAFYANFRCHYWFEYTFLWSQLFFIIWNNLKMK